MGTGAESISNRFRLTGDHWVIGGAGYLGQSVVTHLAWMGGRVLVLDVGDRAAAFVSAAGLGENVTAGSAEADDPDSVPGYFSGLIESRGVPRGLVIMSYASTSKTLADLTAKDFDLANRGNLTSTFLMARQVATAMAGAGGGSIVLFSSMYGSVSPDPEIYEGPMKPNPIEYGVGKAGIQQMARYFAVHFGREGVRCNCISPGPFPNREVQKNHPKFVDRLAKKVPLGRIGQPDEIGGVVSFLLSDAASYINGVNLPVDGGWVAW